MFDNLCFIDAFLIGCAFWVMLLFIMLIAGSKK